MSGPRVSVGFLPLTDAAPVLLAQALHFDAAEGIGIDLVRVPNWSWLRDLLVLGQVDAAQMLAPVPVAMALGLGGLRAAVDALMVLSVNGNTLGVSRALAGRLRARGFAFDFADAAAARDALAATGPVRLGVPFPFSTHMELVHRWVEGSALAEGGGLSVRTVPPPLMAAALAAGEIDAFCVGEPWGSLAVEQGAAELLLPGAAIWGSAPEKVLAMRRDRAEGHPETAGALMRAVWRAAEWLETPGHRITAAEVLARPDFLDLPPETIERALSGQMVISPGGELRAVPRMIAFHAGAAGFAWRSQAAWFARRLARRHGLDPAAAAAAATAVWRSDLYRRHLGPAGADLPAASSRLEGAVRVPTAVASSRGRLILPPDRFFDGAIFDPDAAEC
jgi:NitT/TauT family transport system ATP-binding protein